MSSYDQNCLLRTFAFELHLKVHRLAIVDVKDLLADDASHRRQFAPKIRPGRLERVQMSGVPLADQLGQNIHVFAKAIGEFIHKLSFATVS